MHRPKKYAFAVACRKPKAKLADPKRLVLCEEGWSRIRLLEIEAGWDRHLSSSA